MKKRFIALLILLPTLSFAQTLTPTSFGNVDGWHSVDHEGAFLSLREHCEKGGTPKPTSHIYTKESWERICKATAREYANQTLRNKKHFFAEYFTPMLATRSDGKQGFLTGYFIPELEARLKKGGAFQYPAYALPKDEKDRALPRAATRTGQPLARYVGVGLLADFLAPAAPLRLVNVGKAEAAAFIEAHHADLPCLNPRGLMYAIGAEKDGRLVAVATAGSPTGRWRRLDPRNVLELTRLASDGSTPHAASMLVARLLDLRARSRRGRPDEPALFVTYQLTEAEGAVYRALADKGLRCVARVAGRAPGGARGAGTLTDCQRRTGVTTALSQLDEYRWEAAA